MTELPTGAPVGTGLAPVAQRIAARHRRQARAGGAWLAAGIRERHRPKLLAAATRLVPKPGPGLPPAHAEPPPQPVQTAPLPAGISAADAAWIWGGQLPPDTAPFVPELIRATRPPPRSAGPVTARGPIRRGLVTEGPRPPAAAAVLGADVDRPAAGPVQRTSAIVPPPTGGRFGSEPPVVAAPSGDAQRSVAAALPPAASRARLSRAPNAAAPRPAGDLGPARPSLGPTHPSDPPPDPAGRAYPAEAPGSRPAGSPLRPTRLTAGGIVDAAPTTGTRAAAAIPASGAPATGPVGGRSAKRLAPASSMVQRAAGGATANPSDRAEPMQAELATRSGDTWNLRPSDAPQPPDRARTTARETGNADSPGTGSVSSRAAATPPTATSPSPPQVAASPDRIGAARAVTRPQSTAHPPISITSALPDVQRAATNPERPTTGRARPAPVRRRGRPPSPSHDDPGASPAPGSQRERERTAGPRATREPGTKPDSVLPAQRDSRPGVGSPPRPDHPPGRKMLPAVQRSQDGQLDASGELQPPGPAESSQPPTEQPPPSGALAREPHGDSRLQSPPADKASAEGRSRPDHRPVVQTRRPVDLDGPDPSSVAGTTSAAPAGGTPVQRVAGAATQIPAHRAAPATRSQPDHPAAPATRSQSGHPAAPATRSQPDHPAAPATRSQPDHPAAPATRSQPDHPAAPATRSQPDHPGPPGTAPRAAPAPAERTAVTAFPPPPPARASAASTTPSRPDPASTSRVVDEATARGRPVVQMRRSAPHRGAAQPGLGARETPVSASQPSGPPRPADALASDPAHRGARPESARDPGAALVIPAGPGPIEALPGHAGAASRGALHRSPGPTTVARAAESNNPTAHAGAAGDSAPRTGPSDVPHVRPGAALSSPAHERAPGNPTPAALRTRAGTHAPGNPTPAALRTQVHTQAPDNPTHTFRSSAAQSRAPGNPTPSSVGSATQSRAPGNPTPSSVSSAADSGASATPKAQVAQAAPTAQRTPAADSTPHPAAPASSERDDAGAAPPTTSQAGPMPAPAGRALAPRLPDRPRVQRAPALPTRAPLTSTGTPAGERRTGERASSEPSEHAIVQASYPAPARPASTRASRASMPRPRVRPASPAAAPVGHADPPSLQRAAMLPSASPAEPRGEQALVGPIAPYRANQPAASPLAPHRGEHPVESRPTHHLASPPAEPPRVGLQAERRQTAARASTKAQRLAAATGAASAVEAGGRSSVVFRAPDLGAAPASATAAPSLATTATTTTPPTPPGERQPDPGGVEDLYDRLLERLRRDLLIERERTAGLAFDLY
jgi:hypothetical protein